MKRPKSRPTFRNSLMWSFLIFLIGCTKKLDSGIQDWTPPKKITESEDGLGGALTLYKWGDTLMGLLPLRDGSERVLLMDPETFSWSESRIVGLPPDTLALPWIESPST